VGSVFLIYFVLYIVFSLSPLYVLCPMLPVSIDCPILVAPLIFSYVYIQIHIIRNTITIANWYTQSILYKNIPMYK